MYEFRTLDDTDPLLLAAPVMRALDFLLRQFQENAKGIPLTKTLSFKRAFVAEAIIEIHWHDWSAEDIYKRVRVADEDHFYPLSALHDLLLELKLVRNFKQHLRLTKQGAVLAKSRFKFFHEMAQVILFRDMHFARSRNSGYIMGNWDIWLNVLDIEAASGVSGEQITEALYGPAEGEPAYDMRTSSLYSGVLTPLIWCGLLHENMDLGRKLSDRVYTKTDLWQRYLKLDEKGPMLRVVH